MQSLRFQFIVYFQIFRCCPTLSPFATCGNRQLLRNIFLTMNNKASCQLKKPRGFPYEFLIASDVLASLNFQTKYNVKFIFLVLYLLLYQRFGLTEVSHSIPKYVGYSIDVLWQNYVIVHLRNVVSDINHYLIELVQNSK